MFDKWMKRRRTDLDRGHAVNTLDALAEDLYACQLLATALEIEPTNEAASFVSITAKMESNKLMAEHYRERAAEYEQDSKV